MRGTRQEKRGWREKMGREKGRRNGENGRTSIKNRGQKKICKEKKQQYWKNKKRRRRRPCWLNITATTIKQRTNRRDNRRRCPHLGGRGKLGPVHGDVPISFTTQPRPTTRTHDNTTTKTTRRDSTAKATTRSQSRWSIRTHVRCQATTGSTSSSKCQASLKQTQGFVTINGFWRMQKEELWTTRQGHTFATTGNSKTCHRAAMLIHKRWTKHLTQRSGPRLTESPSRKRSTMSYKIISVTGLLFWI